MLRFGSPHSRDQPRQPHKLGWRIWLLVGLLGVVIGSMQVLEQPATVAQLDALFQPQPNEKESPVAYSEALQVAEDTTGSHFLRQSLDEKANLEPRVDLTQVQDNTYFRPEENDAWFAILESLRKKTSAQIHVDSVGEVTYAQLLAQPNVYRGQVVMVRGRVLREETLDAPQNDVAIKVYHRLVMRPAGGGVWPIIVYCLDLPQSFPRGDKLDVEVAIHGVFFKNWSYAWEEGLGLAPVLLAKTIDAHPTFPAEQSSPDLPTVQISKPGNPAGGVEGGFREVLELVGLGPTLLEKFSTGTDLVDADWQILTQLFTRLQQYNATDLARWTLPTADISLASVGELFEVSGTVFESEPIAVPAELAPLLGVSEIYRCRLRLSNSQIVTLLTPEVPPRWEKGNSLSEPVSSRAVLLRDGGENLLMVTSSMSWYPNRGVPSGQLLLAQHGMDAALWDTVKQRGKFASPETSREAEAFFSCLTALKLIPATQLAEQVSEHLAHQAETGSIKGGKTERQISATVAEHAQQGLSSVVPLFLTPAEHVGELVRLEGIARRAVKIVEETGPDNDNLGNRTDYYELELFTPDSQNLPVVCCVSQLPKGFPLGDEIREQVRIEGVFFKSWRYRSRKLVDSSGETTRQQQRYTPVVLAGTVAWIQAAPDQSGWWGLAAGIGFLFLLALAWYNFAVHWRSDQRPRATDEQLDLPNL